MGSDTSGGHSAVFKDLDPFPLPRVGSCRDRIGLSALPGLFIVSGVLTLRYGDVFSR